MSFWKALQSYQALTADQKIFVQEKNISGTYTPAQWLVFFNKIAAYDALRDASKSKFIGLGCGCAALTLASVIIGFMTLYLLPLAIVMVIALVIFLVFFAKHRKDVPNHLRQFIVPLLHLLREEMKSRQPVFLHVDLRGGTLAEKKYSEQLSATGRQAQLHGSKIKEEYFANQWLVGSAKLADGTLLQWQVFERLRKRAEGKRRSSGKYKTKTKFKVKTRVEAKLIFNHRVYTVAAPIGHDAQHTIVIKPGVRKDKVSVRRVLVSDQADGMTPLGELLEAIASAYRAVKPTGGTS
ncbi:MAG: DUF3784 domain-containing protein [Acidobacteria bacterium]|nr:DUF3784 domain-containing protein [Acidobacteriota bacterium]